jgi:hypothetical protein
LILHLCVNAIWKGWQDNVIYPQPSVADK